MGIERADNLQDGEKQRALVLDKLRSEKVLDRRLAVRRMDALQVRKYVAEVSESLTSDPDGCVRDRSAGALGRGYAPGCGSASDRSEWRDVALPALHAALEDADYGVRSSAAETLGSMGSESSVGPLLALLDDDSTLVVLSALDALVEIGSSAAIGPLEAKCDLVQDRLIRRSMTASIGALKK